MKSSLEVVAAGHICLDIIPTLNWSGDIESILRPGKLVEVGPAVTSTGGSVSNTGLALHRLGLATRLMGKIGDDLIGRAILDILRSYGEELADGMIVTPGEHSSYSVVLSPPGTDRIFLHCSGANNTFVAGDVDYSAIEGARLFHFGYPPLMRRMYADGGIELAAVLERVRGLGVTTSLDMARPDPESEAGRVDWRAILERVLPYVDVFQPSIDEMLFMLDRTRFARLDREGGAAGLITRIDGRLAGEVSDELLGMGVGILAMKMGDRGLYLRTTDDAGRLRSMGEAAPKAVQEWTGRELLIPCFEVIVEGTTGSGDCTIAGFITGLLKGFTPEKAMKAAVGVGAFNVEKADATSGVPAWPEVERRIESGWQHLSREISLDGWHWDGELNLWNGPRDRRDRRFVEISI